LIAALLFFLTLGAAFASPTAAPSTAPEPPQQKPVWEYAKELELTDKQVTDIKAVAQDLENVMKTSQQKLQSLNHDLVDEVETEVPMDLIKGTLEQIAAVQIVAQMANIRTSRAIIHILTPQQLSKWRAMQAQVAP